MPGPGTRAAPPRAAGRAGAGLGTGMTIMNKEVIKVKQRGLRMHHFLKFIDTWCVLCVLTSPYYLREHRWGGAPPFPSF